MAEGAAMGLPAAIRLVNLRGCRKEIFMERSPFLSVSIFQAYLSAI
jgi:hypothetical protein